MTVNAIAPGGFMTDANRRWFRERPALQQEIEAVIPMGRLGEPRVVGVHGAERRHPGLGRGHEDPGAGEAVAPAREGGSGHEELGAPGAGLLDKGGGELGMPGGVVVAADGGGDDLVLVPEDRSQPAPGPHRTVVEDRPGAGGVLPADPGEELVDVVDDLHQAASGWQVSRPQPSGLRAQ